MAAQTTDAKGSALDAITAIVSGDQLYIIRSGTSKRLLITDLQLNKQGTDIASGTNIVIPTDGNLFELTGTTKVDLIANTGWQDGQQVTLIANESVVIDHGTSTSGANITLQLAGAADYSMTAGDVLVLVLASTTAGGQAWREITRSVN